MSDELQKKVNELQVENDTLKQNLAQNQANIEGLISQIEAHREQINESVTMGLNLRAHMCHFKKQHNQLIAKSNELQKQLDAANKRVNELENSKVVSPDGC